MGSAIGSDARVPAGARRARVATAAGFAAQALIFTVLLAHLPQFTDHYGLSQGVVTAVVFVVVVLAGGGSALAELLAARTSSRTTLRVGLAAIALCAAIIGLAPGKPVLFGGFALYGIAVGLVDASTNMQGVAVQHVYGRSIITSFHASWSAAAIVGALYVSAGEFAGLPLRISVLIAAVVVLVVAIPAGRALLPADAVPPAPTPAESAAVDEVATTRNGRALRLLGIAIACFWAVDSSISNWGALYLHDVLHASGGTAALGFAAYQACGFVSRLAGDTGVRRIGGAQLVRIGGVLGVLGALIAVLAGAPVIAVLGFAVIGLGLPVVAPLCFSSAAALTRAAGEGDDPAAVDRIIARLNIFNYVGSLAGAVVVGLIGTVGSLREGFLLDVLLAGALVGLAGVFAAAGWRKHS